MDIVDLRVMIVDFWSQSYRYRRESSSQ